MFLDLILNLALLVALSVLSGFVAHRWPGDRGLGALLQGALFGFAAILGMMRPVVLMEGVVFDGRSVMLSMCALFFGPWAAAVAAVLALVCRLSMGGAGVLMGVLVILCSSGMGLVAHARLRPDRGPVSAGQLYGVGLAVHAVMLLLMLTLPGGIAGTVFRQVGLAVILVFPLATILVGKILSDQRAAVRFVADLQTANKNLEITLQSIGDGVIATDQQGRIVRMNPVAEQLTGWTEQEGRGKPLGEVFSIVDEITREKGVGPVETVLREGRIVGLANHTLLIARDGTERPIADSAAPIRGTDGKIQGVVLVFSDQTGQQVARRALRESEERLRLALNAANQGLYDLNVQTGECVTNAEYARMLGHDPDTFQETNAAWRERLHPEDRDAVYCVYEEYVAGQRAEYRVEFRQRTATGDWKWILSQGKLMSRSADGRPLRMLGTHTDITDRKRMEEKLRLALAEAQRFRAALDQDSAYIYMKDLQSCYTYANRRTLELFGCTTEELAGCDDAHFFPPATAARLREVDLRVFRGEQTSEEIDVPDAKGGRRVYWEVKTPIYGADGRTISGLLGISTDITERKQMEEALQTSVREKQALLKEVHHRVKNNLQVITSLLRLEAAKVNHPITRAAFQDMQDRIRSMALLHETLYRSGNFARVDMATYLGQIATQMFRTQTAAPASNQPGLGLPEPASTVRLELDIAPVQLGVEQAVPCGLIVNELASNCLKHGFPNGRSGVVRVQLLALNGGAQLCLRVSDDGVGLPVGWEERQSRPLGLQLVSDLVRQLEGELEAGAGPGARFAVTFAPVTGGGTEIFRRK